MIVSACVSRSASRLRWFLRFLLRPLLNLRYHMQISGLDAIRHADDGRGVLFLPSHSALIDPLILYSLLPDYLPRPLADARQVDLPFIRRVIQPLRPIVINTALTKRREAVAAIRSALAEAASALQHGEHLLLYPAGRLTRDGREQLGANSGAYTVHQQAPACRVVLVRIRGLWGSSFSAARYGDHEMPFFLRVLLRGAIKLVANGLLFMPRRTVWVDFVEIQAHDLPAPSLGVLPFNNWLETFYNTKPQPTVQVSDFFWRT